MVETAATVGPELKQRVAVYGVCEDGGGKVLLVRAAAYLTVAGDWFLPGGGIDHGEDPESALRREFVEETGLTVVVGRLRGAMSDVFPMPGGTLLHTIRLVYGITSYGGTLRDEEGGSSDIARWTPLHEAFDLPLRPYVREALTALR